MMWFSQVVIDIQDFKDQTPWLTDTQGDAAQRLSFRTGLEEETMLNECSRVKRRNLHSAFRVLSLTAALFSASLFTNSILRAVQEETEPVASGGDAGGDAGVNVPADISEESIERIDEALAGRISPLLATVFDSEASADARRAAAGELTGIVSAIPEDKAGLAGLKTRLVRRISLVTGALNAAEVSDVTSVAPDALPALRSAAEKTAAWLNTIGNGELWHAYLHVAELSSGTASPEVLRQVSANLAGGVAVSSEQRRFLNRPQILTYRGAVESAIAAGSHAGDESGARAELKRQVDQLVKSLLAHETLHLAAEADRARGAWRFLRNRFPAAADVLRPVMTSHYFNHNLHVTVSETLLSRAISDYRTESGRIADCILGAWVTGSQVTHVNVSADVRPSPTTARFMICVDGNTQSNTTAQKDPATVFTRGNHFFDIGKTVTFDGREISSTPGSINVNVNNTTVGVRTKYDAIPILGGIARRIASREVAKSQPKARAVTAQRLSGDALPKFETETQAQFAELNDTLQKTLDSLDAKGVGPDSVSTRSSNTHIAVSSRTMGVSLLGGSTQPPMLLSSRGMAVQVHETVLNNTVDALGFQGRSIPEDQLVTELEKSLTDLLQRKITLQSDKSEPPADPAEEPEPPTTFLFSETDPIRIHFAENELVLVLRMGLLQEGKEEIPEQVISIPIGITLADKKLILEPGTIGITSREDTNRVRQVTRANQIRRVLSRRVIRRELDASFDLHAAADRLLPMTLTMIGISDGWLTAEVQ